MDREDVKLVLTVIAGLVFGCIVGAIFIASITLMVEWLMGG